MFLHGFLGIVIIWAIHHFFFSSEAKKEKAQQEKMDKLVDDIRQKTKDSSSGEERYVFENEQFRIV